MERRGIALTLWAFCAVVTAFGAPTPKYAPPKAVRVSQTINRDWTFNYLASEQEDLKIAGIDFDDSHWKAIAIPHTWQVYETTGDVHPFIMAASEREDPYWWNGWGWYRTRFTLDGALRGKRLFVEFDGVQKYCKVFLNGQLLGEQRGGYNSFCFEITDRALFGRDNVLAVEVSNRRDDPFGTIAPATAGNFNVYGGIYRDVRIVATDPVHIPYQGSFKHEGGTFVTTPLVNRRQGVACVKTFVRNDGAKEARVTVKSVVTDSTGLVVATMENGQDIKPGTTQCFTQFSDTIRNPHLWNCNTPYIYNVYTEVRSGTRLTDTYYSPLGFRWFRWDYDAGTLVVNGEKIHIHGTNRHQEYPWLGDAIPKWITLADMHDIKYNLAHNFIRAAHYPNDPILYDFNDRHGIITVEEVPNIKHIDYSEEIQEENLRAMIRRDRNHPSIFFWSMGNESNDAADSKWAIEEDTTRILHERKTSGYGDYVTHHASDLDMEHLLRVTIRGWYNNDVRDLEPKNDGREERSGQLTGTEEWQHKMARVNNASIRGRIDKNTVAWLYADHGADRIYRDSPLKYVNSKGWVDHYRQPKYMYYLWQANYLERPMVFVHPHFWRSQYLGQNKDIQVDSNCDRVELFANGRSLGVREPSAKNFHTVVFEDVAIERGTLRAVATRGAQKTEWSVVMAGEPARIVLTSSHRAIPADRSGLAIVTADIVDKDGVHVYGATNTLKWELRGEATLVGPEVYTTDTDKNLEDLGCGYIDTPVSNLVRSTAKAGRITLTVTSPGLQSASVELSSTAVPDGGTGISQQRLSDSGRSRVTKDTVFMQSMEYRPSEIRPIFSPARISASGGDYEAKMARFVIDRNPDVDPNTVEFTALKGRLASYIANTKGELTEDDYNFIARNFNDARALAQKIALRNMDPAYAGTMREYYSRRMITEGAVVDVAAELARLSSMPTRIYKVVYSPSEAKVGEPAREGAIYHSDADELGAVVSKLHPNFMKLTAGARVKVLAYICQINPVITKQGEQLLLPAGKIIAIPVQLRGVD